MTIAMDSGRNWLVPALLILTLTAPIPVAQAAGPTGEEDALADYFNARFPLALSADGNWMVYQDRKYLLHRVHLTHPNIKETIQLPTRARGISVSQSAQEVAVMTEYPCIAIVRFSPKAGASKVKDTPRLSWVSSKVTNSHERKCTIEPLSGVESAEPDRSSFLSGLIAISSDGKRVALPGWPIHIFDIATGRILNRIPTESTVLGLRFVDGDRKLLVVQAKMGEQWESPATGSDMQFAVWDLVKGELSNFHSTGTTGNLLPFDLLWSFSETTGQLWAINTNGLYWDNLEGKHDRARIKPYAVNLKSCGGDRQRGLDLPAEEWLDFAADPLGRWVAVVEGRWNKTANRPEARLVVRDSRNGKQLAAWDTDSEIRSLTPSRDGNTLFARSSGKVNERDLNTTRITWTYSGGGKIVRFDLGPKLKEIAPRPETLWATQSCLLEDELPHAREIQADKRKRKLLYEIGLIKGKPQDLANTETDVPCPGNESGQYPLGSYWGVSESGDLWVDRWSTIEQINIRDGKVVKKLPTPRSSTVCTLPLFDSQQFISWQGDTVTLRPFADASGSANRKILVKNPGWVASTVDWRGDRFGVMWVRKSVTSATPELEDRRPAKKRKKPANSDTRAVLYDRATSKVLQEVDLVEGGNDESSEPIDPFAYATQDDQKESGFGAGPKYEWGTSYMQSIRARTLDRESKHVRTVLWDGLRPDVGFKPDANGSFGEVRRLGGSLGIWIQSDSVTLYDAAIRKQLAQLPIREAVSAQWHAVERILLVETFAFVQNNDQGDFVRKLRAFRID
jgi:hypothetical protein